MFHWNEPAAAAWLANLALKSTVLLAAAWVAAWSLRQRTAAARHLVWMAAFAAALALPAFALALPAMGLNWQPAWLTAPTTLLFNATAAASVGGAVAPTPSAVAQAATPAGHSSTPIDWTLFAILLWSGGAAVLLIQMSAAYVRMAYARRRARPFAADSTLPRSVAVLEGAPGSMPLTFGVLNPAIFMPPEACAWSEDRRRMVLRHEFAHVERNDVATHLAARTSLSLLWWNPLAWIAWREFLKEREKAADDLVLESGARATDYAGHLLEIARSMQSEPAAAWAAVAAARRSQLEGRLLSILDASVSRKPTPRWMVLAAAAAAIALCAPFAAVRAQSPQAPLPADVEATIRTATAQKNPEIIDSAAAAFDKERNFETARRLLDSSLQIRAQASGERSGEYVTGLVKIGDLEAKRGNKSEALAFYQKAVSLGDRPEAAPALVYLGMLAITSKDRPSALDYLNRAITVSNSSNTTGKAYMWLALAQEPDPEHAAETEADFQKSISALEPNTSERATALNLYARFLAKQNRDDEAKPLEDQARAILSALLKKDQVQNVARNTQVQRAGGSVTRPELMHKVEPAYTEEARAAKLQGVVVLYVTIGADGTAANFRVIKSLGLGLDEKAIEAVQQWQFKPGTNGGVPTAVAATIEVNFKLL
jgi:TonB family protein